MIWSEKGKAIFHVIRSVQMTLDITDQLSMRESSKICRLDL